MRSPLAAATGAAALAACAPSAAQQRITPPPDAGLQTSQDHDIAVRQIPQETGSPSQRNRVEQLDHDETPRAEVSQLPGDAEILPSAPAPEAGLEQVTRRSPQADLYAEVAAVWELIRRRGQQPTPELIAREIGPDLLARFLNTFPGSEGMFGVDSDVLPIKPPQDPAPPKAGR
ncbi:hypothetical protein [Hephaestia caeni]|uniref:hypothetical protein n=1 Tax=Hephaestia caeni TaxID=645617 RepID=UPI0011C40CB6|nr:hypothetical protein [Hephaestia caeni]